MGSQIYTRSAAAPARPQRKKIILKNIIWHVQLSSFSSLRNKRGPIFTLEGATPPPARP